MPLYTVVAVADNVRQWNSTKGGPMNSYKVTLRNEQGREMSNVEWSRKATSAPPTVGQTLDGTVDTTGEYGPKFKAAATGYQGGGGGMGPRGKTPSEQASIAASVALDKALIAVEQAATFGVVKCATVEEHARAVDQYFEHFFGLIDGKGRAA